MFNHGAAGYRLELGSTKLRTSRTLWKVKTVTAESATAYWLSRLSKSGLQGFELLTMSFKPSTRERRLHHLD